MRTGIVLIAHGSRRPEENDELFRLAEAVRARRPGADVAAAFLELAEPTIPHAVAECVSRGAQRVLLFPYFLSPGMHVTRDLESHRTQLAAEHPHVEFRLAPPLGAHPEIVRIVLDLLSDDSAARPNERAAPDQSE